MKPHAFLLAAALAAPSLAVADGFSEYRIPEHSWVGGAGAFSLNARRSHNSYEPYAEDRKSAAGAGQLGAQVRGGFDSDRRQYSWGLAASEVAQASHEETRYEPGAGYRTLTDRREQGHAQEANLLASLRLYPGASPIGFELAAQASGRWGQQWRREEQDQSLASPSGFESSSRVSRQEHDYLYLVRWSGAAGHGIVRDVTVVEDVHLMEARLERAGALARPLSAAAREKLARLMSVTSEISFAHERPARFAWREVERVLAEDGALAGGGLDAYGARLLADPNAARVTRLRGHFVGVTLVLEHDNQIRRIDDQQGSWYAPSGGPVSEFQYDSSNRYASSRDAAFAGLRAEWHRPVGWAWQWSARGSVAAPIRPGEHGLRTDAALDGSWRIADRWLAQATLWQSRDYLELGERDDSPPRDSWSVQARAALNWFVEDRTTLFLELAEYQGRSRIDYGGLVYASGLQEARVSAGVSYRFLGRVSAPGLFEPLSLLR